MSYPIKGGLFGPLDRDALDEFFNTKPDYNARAEEKIIKAAELYERVHREHVPVTDLKACVEELKDSIIVGSNDVSSENFCILKKYIEVFRDIIG